MGDGERIKRKNRYLALNVYTLEIPCILTQTLDTLGEADIQQHFKTSMFYIKYYTVL